MIKTHLKKACDPLKPFKRQFIIIRNAIKIIMVMSLGGVGGFWVFFLHPLYIFFSQK